MRRSLVFLGAALVATLACAACTSRGPYVTSTPSRTPRVSSTPGPTKAAKLTRTAQAAGPTAAATLNATRAARRTMTARASTRKATPTPTWGPTRAARHTQTAQAREAGATSTQAVAAPTRTPQDTQTRIVPDAPPTPPGFDRTTSSGVTLSTGAFAEGGEIPIEYTCHGENTSPALDWANLPAGTASLAITMLDPDAQPAGFVHWLIYNIPAGADGLPPDIAPRDELNDGSRQGSNSFASLSADTFDSGAPIHKIGYDGPCPPAEHRYVFTLYALDAMLDLPARATIDELAAAMQNHILAQAQLTGRFAPPE